MSAVDIRTATIAEPPARLKTTNDPLVDFLIAVVEGIQPVERRAEWLRCHLPRTAAWLGATKTWHLVSELEE